MIFFKRTLPVLICLVTGLVLLAQYYVPTRLSKDVLENSANTAKVVIGFSYLIGLYSLLHLHTQKIQRRQAGWGYSFLVFFGCGLMLFFGLAGEAQKGIEVLFGVRLEFADFQTYSPEGQGTVYQWLFKWVYSSAATTMFSLLAFFIASAAFRTFRAKTAEAGLLLVAALIVIFGRVPISGAVHEIFPDMADWIMLYPNLAAKRGILIGISIGMVGTALRVIFGLERAYVGGD